MRTLRHLLSLSLLVGASGFLASSPALPAAMPNMPGMQHVMPGAKIPDPTKVVIIVNRDSNDIAFMDIATKKILAKTFLGNNVNPHMAMMSPDARYVVTGGQ